jgi:hypothetical protein
MNHTRRLGAVLVLSLLAGCGGSGDWTKTGGDEGSAAREYADCRALAGDAVRTDADIDQDILATRQSDWQRAAVVRQQTRVMQEQTRDRAAAIIESCMKAKGFSQKR